MIKWQSHLISKIICHILVILVSLKSIVKRINLFVYSSPNSHYSTKTLGSLNACGFNQIHILRLSQNDYKNMKVWGFSMK